MDGTFGALCDEFHVTTRLFLKLEVPLGRETVLHFFDRLRRTFPSLNKLRRRDDGSLVLEDGDGEGAARRWLRLHDCSLRFGQFAPTDLDEYARLAELVLEQAPHHLTFGELDFDHMETVYGFDLEYRGNHDALVAQTFFGDHVLSGFLEGDDVRHTIECQPYFGVALTPNCDVQAAVEVKSRTTTYEVRTGEYENQMLSVQLTVRKYWGFSEPRSLVEEHRQLISYANDLALQKVIPVMVKPLAQAIAGRP